MTSENLLIVWDDVIQSVGIMRNKCVHPIMHFYAYRIPEDIINNHINKINIEIWRGWFSMKIMYMMGNL